MNKDVIRELMDLRTDILAVNPLPNMHDITLMQSVIDKLNNIIIDSMGEDREDKTCCTCEDCPALKKMDNLIEATKLREWLEETASKTALEVEKMARGGTD